MENTGECLRASTSVLSPHISYTWYISRKPQFSYTRSSWRGFFIFLESLKIQSLVLWLSGFHGAGDLVHMCVGSTPYTLECQQGKFLMKLLGKTSAVPGLSVSWRGLDPNLRLGCSSFPVLL